MKKNHPPFLSFVNLRGLNKLKEMTNRDKVIEEHLLVPLVQVALLVMMRYNLLSNILRNSRALSAIIHVNVGCRSL